MRGKIDANLPLTLFAVLLLASGCATWDRTVLRLGEKFHPDYHEIVSEL